MTGPTPVFAHSWDLSPGEARSLQSELNTRVRFTPLSQPIRSVAGVDVSIKHGRACASVAVLSMPHLKPVETVTSEMPVSFPYIPGLLAFREGPVVLAALKKLESSVDLLIFDAQGIAHPRRLGLAAHMGVILDMLSVGCAKSRLCGTHEEPGPEKGSWVRLRDKGETIGAVLRTRTRVRPVYVSVGHRIDLEGAIKIVLDCCTKYRLPEPTRRAHQAAGSPSFNPI